VVVVVVVVVVMVVVVVVVVHSFARISETQATQELQINK